MQTSEKWFGDGRWWLRRWKDDGRDSRIIREEEEEEEEGGCDLVLVVLFVLRFAGMRMYFARGNPKPLPRSTISLLFIFYQ